MSGKEWPPEKIYIHQALLNSAVEQILPYKVMPDDIYRDDPPPPEWGAWYHEYVQAEALTLTEKVANNNADSCKGLSEEIDRLRDKVNHAGAIIERRDREISELRQQLETARRNLEGLGVGRH